MFRLVLTPKFFICLCEIIIWKQQIFIYARVRASLSPYFWKRVETEALENLLFCGKEVIGGGRVPVFLEDWRFGF